jgi:hypothetical protein
VIREHLEHLKAHNETGYMKEAMAFLKERGIEVPSASQSARHDHGSGGCPGSRVVDLGKKQSVAREGGPSRKAQSELRQWPIQIMLVPSNASYFKDADLLIAADCVGFACPDFHADLLKGKTLLVGCPKLDDVGFYAEKMADIVKANDIKSITYAHMEVPCCYGLIDPINEAIKASGKKIPFRDIIVGIGGELSG